MPSLRILPRTSWSRPLTSSATAAARQDAEVLVEPVGDAAGRALEVGRRLERDDGLELGVDGWRSHRFSRSCTRSRSGPVRLSSASTIRRGREQRARPRPGWPPPRRASARSRRWPARIPRSARRRARSARLAISGATTWLAAARTPLASPPSERARVKRKPSIEPMRWPSRLTSPRSLISGDSHMLCLSSGASARWCAGRRSAASGARAARRSAGLRCPGSFRANGSGLQASSCGWRRRSRCGSGLIRLRERVDVAGGIVAEAHLLGNPVGVDMRRGASGRGRCG